MGSVKNALLPLSSSNEKCIPCKGKTFSRYKTIQQFFPECTEQNLPARLSFCMKYMQLNIRFIYHERNNCQDVMANLLESSVEKFCCFHLKADTAMLFLYSRIREYDQTTPVRIDSEDTDAVMMCAYAALIINGKLAIRRKRNNFSAKELCSKKCLK